MKSVSSRTRFIITGIVGILMLVGLYAVLFTGDDVVDTHDDAAIDVHDAWVRATAAAGSEAEGDLTGITSAAYMEISNHSDSDRRLVGASAVGVGMVEIHQTTIENEVAHMEHQAEGVLIPADQTITLEPGGLHLMLMALEAPLVEGGELTITLQFDDGSSLTVTAPIRVD